MLRAEPNRNHLAHLAVDGALADEPARGAELDLTKAVREAHDHRNEPERTARRRTLEQREQLAVGHQRPGGITGEAVPR
jgi:hypothetical protein